MLTGLISKGLLNKVVNGEDLTGYWESIPNIFYQFFPNSNDNTECVFQTFGSVTVEYHSGSTIDFLFQVSYKFSNLSGQPLLHDTVFFANDAIQKINELFKSEMNTTEDKIVNSDNNSTIKAVEAALNEAYPHLS